MLDVRRRGRAGAWATCGLRAGGGRDGGPSSRCGAALSEGVSADDWGRSAEGPRRCMGHLRIVGGRPFCLNFSHPTSAII